VIAARARLAAAGLACRRTRALDRYHAASWYAWISPPSSHGGGGDRVDHLGEWLLVAERRPLSGCPVRPLLVEVPDVRDEHLLEVAAAEDQQPVEALAANVADPTFDLRWPSAPAPAP
jgi:hypothetical protein